MRAFTTVPSQALLSMLATTVLGLGTLATNSVLAQEFTVSHIEDGVQVDVDGQLFTRYLNFSGAKPIMWPLIGPQGQELTRGYPMRDATEKEKEDHIHHRSFWFTHGDVNGVSYWHEQGGNGTIQHRTLTEVEQGDRAVIATENDWTDPDGNTVCRDERRFEFHADGDLRWIDVTITVSAGDSAVTFGDTKEGSFGVRVAGSMRTELEDGGRILNSEGQTDGDAWGKRAAWVDYSGPVDDIRGGITILNHPDSFRFPTYWHVRTYGLFAANPFGWHDFLRDPEADGSQTLQPGESFTLKYRVLLHNGELSADDLAAQFESYAGR